MIFRQAPELREIAKQIQENWAVKWKLFHIDLNRVGFLYESSCEETKYAGECRQVGQPWKGLLEDAGIDWDYVIEVYGFHAEGKSREWLQILLYHEMRHIGFDGKLVKHNIEDFRDVLLEFGLDWHADKELPDILKLKPRIE